MKLEDSELRVKYFPDENVITFDSSSLVKSLFISHKKIDLKLTDNYFDVVPNRVVKVRLLGDVLLRDIQEGFEYVSYRQVYDPSQLRVRVEHH